MSVFRVVRAMFLLVAALCAASAARADHAPSFVVPGRADVPVMINGYDASWGVVEGDWGLSRPGAVPLTVIPAPYARPLAPARHYFPSLGAAPNAGRYEIEPPANRVLPLPAPSFHRDWSTGPDPSVSVTEYPPMPPVIVAPSDARRHWHPRH
jgi:hypothetical protein